MRISSIFLLFLLMSGCYSRPKENQGEEHIPSNLVYLTWEDYIGIEGPQEVEFFLNEKSMGRGTQGFDKALKAIPRGSTVVIYPDYILDICEKPSSEIRDLPYDLDKLMAWGKANPAIGIIRSLEKQFQRHAFFQLKNEDWVYVRPAQRKVVHTENN